MGKMKDSGIEWIGQIPENWNVNKGKYFIKYIERPTREDDEVITCFRDGEVTLRSNRREDGFTISEKEIGYQGINKGDLIVHGMDGFAGAIGISDSKGKSSPVLNVLEPKGNKKFYMYYLRNMAYGNVFLALSTGIRVRTCDTNWKKLRELPYLIPPIDIQNKIAKFLDAKCSEINILYSDIEKQIETLEEYKKSVITEAVTKGLNPDVEMKDSRIEWIGEMPETWSIIRLKYASWLKGRIGWQGLRADEFIEDENCPYLITGTDFKEGYINWNTCVHITNERYLQDFSIHIQEDDLLITKDGTIGKVAVAKNCPEKVSLNSGVFIIRNTGKYKYNDRYMYYLIQSEQFLKWYDLSNAGNSTIKHLNQEKFYNFQFTYPEVDEQIEIAKYLDEKCSEIDMAIKEKKAQAETLGEYKKSLIYEYVTGKKEVPDNE